MSGRIILCWVCEEERATHYFEGHPICEACLEHFTAGPRSRAEYVTADAARDLRFGGDVC